MRSPHLYFACGYRPISLTDVESRPLGLTEFPGAHEQVRREWQGGRW
jgi:hypothetical protein